MEINLAKIINNIVTETMSVSEEEYNESINLDSSLVISNGKVAVGDVYSPANESFSTPNAGVPNWIADTDIPVKPTPRFDGETFSLNPTSLEWESDEMAKVRNQRDILLAAMDFTQLPDFPEGDYKTACANYRNALRVIPEQYRDNPHEVFWPEIPSTIT